MNRLVISLLTLFALFGCSPKEVDTTKGAESDQTIKAADLKLDSNGLSEAKIVMKLAHGNIAIKLYAQKAPNTVTRFIELTRQGFYDGLSFHRVVANFVVQTGDPTGSGMGGSGKKLKAELNPTQHIKGTVGMARPKDKDSADSQFYIALTTISYLDGNYTVFGQVTEGLELLEKIVKDDKILSMTFQP